MPDHFQHLGPFSDWPAAQARHALFPLATLGAAALVFGGDEVAHDPRVEQTWEWDGLLGTALSWSVGYGPRTATA